MRDLRIEGLSDDKRFLVARDVTTGEKFRLPADQRLTSLISTQSTRTGQSRPGSSSGQLEIRMESSLSPRDIQTRIRRGESPQSVADSAGVTVESISGFAGPVLAEREFMCEQARKTTIRRKHIGGAGVLLGTLVDDNIVTSGGVPESALWDSWRREDGRWTVTVTPADREHPASFLFDVKSRYVMPADEFAHDLVGDVALPDSTDMAIADAVRSAGRTAEPLPAEVDEPVAQEQTPEPEQAAEEAPLVHDEPLTLVSSLKEARDRRALEQLAITESEQAAETPVAEVVEDDFEESLEANVAVPDTIGPRGKKRHERRRVPSWDEIMFGDKSD